MKKGPVELGANEKEEESESKVTNQIFGCLQHPKKRGEIFGEYFCQTSEAFFPFKVFFHKSSKSKYYSIYKNENCETRFFQ